jgi:hypothetical protein
MVQKLNNYLFVICCLTFFGSYAQQEIEGVHPHLYKDHKSDTSFKDFNQLKQEVAKAQINALKNGALLVRLKTNENSISKLKAAGNYDLAAQIERETYLNNKQIVKGFVKEFNFCPVYFFYSTYSDSVKHKNPEGIFLDTNLVLNPNIKCVADFYLIAENGGIYDSSIGIVPIEQAEKAKETGTVTKNVAIVVKNRYYIQLHKPFPFFQKGYSLNKYSEFVKKFNKELEEFYFKNRSFIVPDGIKQFVY